MIVEVVAFEAPEGLDRAREPEIASVHGLPLR